MKWILAAGVLGGIGWLWYACVTEPETPRYTGADLMERFKALGGQDPEDPSKLETLRQIARAQESRRP